MKIGDETTFDRTIIWLAALLITLLLPLSVLYFWQESLNFSSPINDGKFGTFGDFVGGVFGSLWSLCGVILFYLALKDQRKDFRNNNQALLKQIEALEMQGKEFKLQRNEMELTRNVSREQSKTIRSQRLDATYFSLIDLYKNTVSALNSKDEFGNYFKSLKSAIYFDIEEIKDPVEKHESMKARYSDEYFKRKEELSHYFKTIYRVLKIIDEAEISDIEKFRYIKILRSQLSENEALALYYNSHSDFGGEFYKFILKYNFLKHLPCTSKTEFFRYLQPSTINRDQPSSDAETNKHAYHLHLLSKETIELIRKFQITLENKINEDNFEELKFSVALPSFDEFIISLNSSEYNELLIQVSRADDKEIHTISQLEKKVFENFFCDLLYDTFLFSKYIPLETTERPIQINSNDHRISFKIKSTKKLSTNSDME